MEYFMVFLFIAGIASISIFLSYFLHKLKPILIFVPAVILIVLMAVSIIIPRIHDYGLGGLAFVLFFIFFLFSLIINLIFSIIYLYKTKKSVN